MSSGRKPELTIVHCPDRSKPWLVNVPASLSENGKRQRDYYTSKRHAEARVRELTRISTREESRSDLTAALEPFGASLWDAVNFFTGMQQRFGPQLEEFGATIDDAIRFYLENQQERAASCEFCEAADEFKAAKAHRRQRTKNDYDHVFGKLTSHFKGRLLRDITPRDIEAALGKECPGDFGRRKFMAVLKTLYNWSIRRDYASQNPILKLDPVEIRPSQKPILSNEEVRQLLSVCSDEILPYYLFGTFCGIRPKELQRLEWKHVNFEERHIHVPGSASKTWEHRYVDIADNLFAWLDIYGRARCGKICPGDFANKHRANYKRSGLKKWHQDVMRHTFASNHLAHFGDLDALLQAMGHRSSPQTLWRYYHRARTKTEAADFWAISPECRTGEPRLAALS
jgi:integrase/recombinase XerD